MKMPARVNSMWLGSAARCHGADRPLHRRRRHRPLPGYGVSRSRDSTIWFTRSERALGTDPPRATTVQLKRRCVRFCSRMTMRLPSVLTPADTPAIVRGVDETVGVALVEVYDLD